LLAELFRGIMLGMTKTTSILASIIFPAALLFWGGIVVAATNIRVLTPDRDVTASSPEITTSIISRKLDKVDKSLVLARFFKKFKSPLIQNVDKFVEVAEKYDMDYRLLPAISCQESTCGKFLIPGSFNPFGWGIYGAHHIDFNSYDEAIETVGAGLFKSYISRGYDTVEEIAPIYTPPSWRHWMGSVNFFMKEMDKIQTEVVG
jgi:hypothetical protein